MSEDRLERIESKLDSLAGGQAEMRADIADLKAGQAKQDVAIAQLTKGQEDSNRHMRVLHEDVLERIKDLTFDPEPLRREFRVGLADLREEFGRR